MTLLGAMAVVRLVVYVLRRVFRRMTWIAPFERALALVIWFAVALYITGLSSAVGDWLDAHTLPFGAHHVSLSTLLAGASAVIVTLLLALWLGSAIDARLMRAPSLDNNVRIVLSRVFRALLLVIAVLAALAFVGIDLTVLSVFGGALGVGLGLGLQRIASNYVSGFIILLDRSLRIGDIIGVDKYFGEVSEIKTRYTVLHALDGTEAILPNEMLVSTPVTNYSYNNRLMRASVKVTVDYETDLAPAMALMCDAARVQPRVLTDPAPATMVLNLGADGVELEVGFWIADPELGRGNVESDVALELLKCLRAAGVKIPSARREVKLHGAAGAVLASEFPMPPAKSPPSTTGPASKQAPDVSARRSDA